MFLKDILSLARLCLFPDPPLATKEHDKTHSLEPLIGGVYRHRTAKKDNVHNIFDDEGRVVGYKNTYDNPWAEHVTLVEIEFTTLGDEAHYEEDKSQPLQICKFRTEDGSIIHFNFWHYDLLDMWAEFGYWFELILAPSEDYEYDDGSSINSQGPFR